MGMWTGYAQGLQIRNAREDEERRRRQEQANRDREFARQREIDAQNQQNRDREFAATQEEREFNRQFKADEARREQANADRSFGLALDKAQADVDAQNRRLDMEENNSAWTNAIHEENLRKARMLNDEQQKIFQQRQAKRDADMMSGANMMANLFTVTSGSGRTIDTSSIKGYEGYSGKALDPSMIEKIMGDKMNVKRENGSVATAQNVIVFQKPDDAGTRHMAIQYSDGQFDIVDSRQLESYLTSTFGDAEDASRMVYGIGTKEREENRKLSLQHQMRIDERRMDAFDRQRGSVYRELAKGTLTQEEADSVLDAIDERERRVFKRDGAGEPAPSEFESAMQKFAKENPRSVYREGDRWCVKSPNGSCVTVTEQNYKQLIGGGATAVRTTNPSQKVNATPVNSTPKNSPVTNEQQKNTAPVPKVEVENKAVETGSAAVGEPDSVKQDNSTRQPTKNIVNPSQKKSDDPSRAQNAVDEKTAMVANAIVYGPNAKRTIGEFAKSYHESHKDESVDDIENRVSNGELNEELVEWYNGDRGNNEYATNMLGLRLNKPSKNGMAFVAKSQDQIDRENWNAKPRLENAVERKKAEMVAANDTGSRLSDAAKNAMQTAAFAAGGGLATLASWGIVGTSAKKIADGKGTMEDGIVIATALLRAGKSAKDAYAATRKFGIEMNDAAMERAISKAEIDNTRTSRAIPKPTIAKTAKETGYTNADPSLAYTRVRADKKTLDGIIRDGFIRNEKWFTSEKLAKGTNAVFDDTVGKMAGKGKKGQFGNAIITVKKDFVGEGKTSPKLSDLEGIWVSKDGKKVNILPDIIKQHRESATVAKRAGNVIGGAIGKHRAAKIESLSADMLDKVVAKVSERMGRKTPFSQVEIDRIRTRANEAINDITSHSTNKESVGMLKDKNNVKWITDYVVSKGGKWMK